MVGSYSTMSQNFNIKIPCVLESTIRNLLTTYVIPLLNKRYCITIYTIQYTIVPKCLGDSSALGPSKCLRSVASRNPTDIGLPDGHDSVVVSEPDSQSGGTEFDPW